jgi:hypothetical protein
MLFTGVFNLRKGHVDAFFITGYKDVKKDGNFISSSNQVMPRELLMSNFKQEKSNQCSGLRLHLSQNKSGYGSVPCFQRNLLMCQVSMD